MLADDLIQPPFQRAAKAEVVVRDCDHLVCLDCPHQPTRQFHLAVVQAEPFVVGPNEPAFVDQRKDAGFDLAAGLDIGDELRALKTGKGVFKALVVVAADWAVGRNGQLPRREAHCVTNGLAPVLARHQLADGENQNVLVEDRGQAQPRWSNLQNIIAAAVFEVAHVRLRRQREQRVFHGRHVIFRHRIRDVEDKEIKVWVAIWQQTHMGNFDLSGTHLFDLSGTRLIGELNTGLAASKQNHFLVGPDALAIVHPAILGEGGIQQRADCS